ncbi:flavin reductase (plasmid) [Rhodococcus oxybenzonivorans]|uniref:Flavin reductase n=1 Tax=Rhodococcus oxybenzonivorans TaxID=1990687 RepID=A0A2S2C5V9_9NOCA|nr:flavin reductase family protein [Rhodococcus oxybenzonivorans]AWK76266.1 flavin reductase [Rhodococcus oxybenzonivorans]
MTITQQATEIGPADMRNVLGHFCSGVTVITAMSPAGPIGFTCQSFASLSLDPPLVSFGASRTSSSWPKVRRAQQFCINVLADGQDGVSNAFARSGTDKFAGVAWRPSLQGAPILDGVVAWVDCSLWAEYDGGDHTVVVASVTDLGEDKTLRPLLFHRGAYGLQTATTRQEEVS